MKQYGILAFPAKHSLSPVMHNAAFKELGIDAQYGVFEVSEKDLPSFMDRVKHEPISGLSISLPYKEVVMQHLAEVDDDARNIGAVNTVVNQGGFLYGYNTDFIGSNKALEEICGDLVGKKVVVVGAGGASRAICYGLLKNGSNVAIFNRHKEKAQKIENDFAKIFGDKIESGGYDEMFDIEDVDILIQATSIWTLNPDMDNCEQFLPSGFIERFEVVMDIVYKPLETPLLRLAKGLDKKVITGERMLLHQAVGQFELWTGEKAPVKAMNDSLINALG